MFDVGHNNPRIVVGDIGTPAYSNAPGAVHEHHWNDRNVPLGLDALDVVNVFQDWIVMDAEQFSRQRAEKQAKFTSTKHSSCKLNTTFVLGLINCIDYY